MRERDAIGVVSPASPGPALRPGRFERGARNPEATGFRIRVAENTRATTGHTAGSVEQRVADLHAMLGSEEVRAIFCSIGGYNSDHLLDRLDYGLVRDNPKILVGYSDPTFLLLGIHALTGLVTFLGPTVMCSSASTAASAPTPSVRSARPSWTPTRPASYPLRRDDPRVPGVGPGRHPAPPRGAPRGPEVLKPAKAEGHVVAGNPTTLLALAGTPYFPDLEGAALCVEASEEEPPAWTDRDLTHLRLTGTFEKIRALVVGRAHPGGVLPRRIPLKGSSPWLRRATTSP